MPDLKVEVRDRDIIVSGKEGDEIWNRFCQFVDAEAVEYFADFYNGGGGDES